MCTADLTSKEIRAGQKVHWSYNDCLPAWLARLFLSSFFSYRQQCLVWPGRSVFFPLSAVSAAAEACMPACRRLGLAVLQLEFNKLVFKLWPGRPGKLYLSVSLLFYIYLFLLFRYSKRRKVYFCRSEAIHFWTLFFQRARLGVYFSVIYLFIWVCQSSFRREEGLRRI